MCTPTTASGEGGTVSDPSQTNRDAAIRFIEVPNNDTWDDLPGAVAADFVLDHPMGRTMRSTVPPNAGASSVDTEASRSLVTRFFDTVLNQHDLEALATVVSENILVHPTAMPLRSNSSPTSCPGAIMRDRSSVATRCPLSDESAYTS